MKKFQKPKFGSGIWSLKHYEDVGFERHRKYKSNGMWGVKRIVDLRLANVTPQQRVEIRLWIRDA